MKRRVCWLVSALAALVAPALVGCEEEKNPLLVRPPDLDERLKKNPMHTPYGGWVHPPPVGPTPTQGPLAAKAAEEAAKKAADDAAKKAAATDATKPASPPGAAAPAPKQDAPKEAAPADSPKADKPSDSAKSDDSKAPQ
jgi:hypothetical protein